MRTTRGRSSTRFLARPVLLCNRNGFVFYDKVMLMQHGVVPANSQYAVLLKESETFSSNMDTGKQLFFNSVIAAFTGWNDPRNRGNEALVFGDCTPMDGLTVWSVPDFMGKRCFAFKL